MCAGWGNAAEVAKRAAGMYKSPKKRGQVSTMLTIDQVRKRKNAFECKRAENLVNTVVCDIARNSVGTTWGMPVGKGRRDVTSR